MKEIKAYIQRCCVTRAVDALQKNGALGITIVDIHPVGYGYEPNNFAIQYQDTYKRYGHLRIVKLEVVCADQDVDRLVRIIQKECRTPDNGDGMIFVADVSAAFRIRDGAYGEAAL
jgi:nitrogen regulatory protein P-II 1